MVTVSAERRNAPVSTEEYAVMMRDRRGSQRIAVRGASSSATFQRCTLRFRMA